MECITVVGSFRIFKIQEQQSVLSAFLLTDDEALQEKNKGILPLNGCAIEPPERFAPQAEFIAWHRNELFVDSRK